MVVSLCVPLSLSLSLGVTGVLCRFPLRLLNFSKRQGTKTLNCCTTKKKGDEKFWLLTKIGTIFATKNTLKDVLFEVPSGVSRESGRADARGDDDDDDDDDAKRRR